MNRTTALTVADCRSAFGALFTSSEFIGYLNQAVQQLIISGRWTGSLERVTFNSVNGYITLPYEYSGLIGIVRENSIPTDIFSEMHYYTQSGPGWANESLPWLGFLTDLGDNYATYFDPPTAGSTLKFVLDNVVDVGQTIRLYGISNGLEIFDVNGRGMNVTFTGLTTTEATVFDQVTGIEFPVDANGAPAMQFPMNLYSVAPDATETYLSRYYPPDIRPKYHRYSTGTSTKPVHTLCQIRYIPCYKETDWVFPGNMRAIKAAMQAVQNEDANNYAEAVPNWNIAYDTLNKMTHSSRAGARPEFDWQPLGVPVPFPNIT